MELALSVGSEATRKRKVYCASGDRCRHMYPLTENVIQEGGGCGDSRNCPPIQLDLKLSWSSDDTGTNYEGESRGGLDVNQSPARKDRETDVGASSSDSHPTAGRKHNWEADVDRASSRCSDEEEAGSTRKKLRLSSEQSCYLEESFKQHRTLNTKQKLALAKQLNLRPRQVEVWFQNRRARTKLKQTEVDCEYLKRCCKSLTEENRRLHKELQDLKALKTPTNPFRMHVPATTLTMCPPCERVSEAAPAPVTDTAAAAPGGNQNQNNPSSGFQSQGSVLLDHILFPFLFYYGGLPNN